jgi:hypothetical protein
VREPEPAAATDSATISRAALDLLAGSEGTPEIAASVGSVESIPARTLDILA